MIREDKKESLDSRELREELSRMLSAWQNYSLGLLASKELKKFFSSVIMGLGISLITWSTFWLVKNSVYAQSEAAINSTSSLSLAFPWIMSGSIVSVIIGFARTKYQLFKRCFDLVVSSLSILLLLPLFLIIAILIKIDSEGPVFFRQERFGKNRTIFKMWKFRTMRKNAELETGPVWAEDNDPRVTRLGQFLRRAHI
jgi:hypothetical protein